MINFKTCTNCKKSLEIQLFYKNNTRKDGFGTECKACHKNNGVKRIRENYLNPNRVFTSLLNNARKRNINFDIDKETFQNWYKQNDKCSYCFIDKESQYILRNKWTPYKNKDCYKMSVDRINSKIGYNIDNMVLCCTMCNVTKGYLISYDEMKVIGKSILNIKWKSML